MNDQSELENLLAKSTPLPCSIDSMELMFAAGVEQQKRRARHERRLTLTLGSCAGTFLISSLVLGWMAFSLTAKNSELVASLSEIERSSRADESRRPSQQDEPRLAIQQESNQPTRIDDDIEFELTTVSRQSYVATPRAAINTVLQRGVTLNQWDEYRDPADGYLASESERLSQPQQTSNPYIRLRQELQGSIRDASQGL